MKLRSRKIYFFSQKRIPKLIPKNNIKQDFLFIFPEEITVKVLDYCNARDILQLGRCSKSWWEFIETSRKPLEKVVLTVTKDNCMKISKCSRKYVNIKIKCDELLSPEQLNPTFQTFLSSMRSLETSGSNILLVHLPKLRELYIHEYNQVSERSLHNMLEVLKMHSNQIEILHMELINADIVVPAVNTLPNLRALWLLGNFNANEEDFKVNNSIKAIKMIFDVDCFQSVPNLEFLKIKTLNIKIVKKIFAYNLRLKVVEYDYLELDFDSLALLKNFFLKYHKFDFDKENKSNVRFIKSSNYSAYWNFYAK